jgi:apolipoprotein N-acyltransferase
MKKTNHFKKIKEALPSVFTLFSATLIVLSFLPGSAHLLIWIALCPWFETLKRARSRKQALREGFWLGALMSLGGFFWLVHAIHQYGGFSWFLSFCIFFLGIGWGELQFSAFSWIAQPLMHKPSSVRLSTQIALLYTGIDWLTPKLFQDTLGHTLHQAPHLSQAADLGGVFLLTFLIVYTNHTIWKYFSQRAWKKFQKTEWTAIAALVSFWIYGSVRLHQLESLPEKTISVAAIQSNIADFEKIAAKHGSQKAGNQILQTFLALTQEAMNHPTPDLVIWPETAYPSYFRSPQNWIQINLDRELEHFLKKMKIPIIFGGYDISSPRTYRETYNGLFLVNPNGDFQTYRKNILLPFAEYIPGYQFFPFLKEAFPQIGYFGTGTLDGSLKVQFNHSENVISITPLICCEVLFSSFVLKAVGQDKSQLMVNITNDSWFGNWGEPQLHLALASFRSIENRLPLIRATNTGISALILATGAIVQPTHLNEKCVLKTLVPINRFSRTLIQVWGDWFGPFALAISFLGSLKLLRKKFTNI